MPKKIFIPIIVISLLLISVWLYSQQQNTSSSTNFIPDALSSDYSKKALIDPTLKHLLKKAPNSIPTKNSASEIVEQIINERPDIIIVPENYYWQLISPSSWFQVSYIQDKSQPQEENILIFTRKPWGKNQQIEPINVSTDLGANLIGYSISPKNFIPDEPIYISLYWQANDTITPFNTILTIVSTVNGTPRAQVTELTPHSIPGDYWKKDQVIEERLVLSTIPETDAGSYALNLSVRNLHSNDLLPMHQNNDNNTLDTVTISHISTPRKKEIPVSAEIINSSFSDSIKLHAKEINYDTPQNNIGIDLYWQVTAQPQDNYTIFIHLLDKDGNFILGRDTLPRDGTYITSSWQPEQTIKDSHTLTLPEDLAAGTYTLKVGMYDRETQERLTVDEGGNANVLESTITIGQIEHP